MGFCDRPDQGLPGFDRRCWCEPPPWPCRALRFERTILTGGGPVVPQHLAVFYARYACASSNFAVGSYTAKFLHGQVFTRPSPTAVIQQALPWTDRLLWGIMRGRHEGAAPWTSE